ncbi:MAG: glucosaminidase domain-containing protein [Hyphomicrobiaceae bacterium]
MRTSLGFLIGATVLVGSVGLGAGNAAALPEIRTHERNKVPACVTPARLMRYLRTGNSRLPMRFADIASHYKEHGDRLNIRWDYAFFQMILETNYLKFKNGSGQGDVDPGQNNFAGIGTTGGGVPGDRYPDVSTGVLAQMQHLIAYSGQRVDNPVGRRTREKQDEIIQKSKALGRPVTFKDLTRRWAVDSRYGTSIEFVATRFRSSYCNGRQPDDDETTTAAPEVVAAATEPTEVKERQRGSKKKRRGGNREAQREVARAEPPVEAPGRDIASRTVAEQRESGAQRAGLGMPRGGIPPAGACKVFTASYGGQKNMLIRVQVGGEVHYTALQVLDGMERSLTETFVTTHTKGGELVSEHPNRETALAKAFDLCPTAARSN